MSELKRFLMLRASTQCVSENSGNISRKVRQTAKQCLGCRLTLTPSTICMWLGVLFVLAGAISEGYIISTSQLFLLVGVALVAFAFFYRSDELASPGSRQELKAIGNEVQQRIEQLEDARWRIHDSTNRTRELLDAQKNVIYACDHSGRLTFVNRAYCKIFGVKSQDVINTHYSPREVDDNRYAQVQLNDYSRLFDEGNKTHIQTVDGPRWFLWRESEVPSIDGLGVDRQFVGTDVTYQLKVEAELFAAQEEAQAASRAKSRFLASMSHEIRTPMNGIIGMGGLLLETKLTSDQKSYVEAVDLSARALMSLIDEILDFSRIEAGHLKLEDQPFSPYDTLQSVVELLAPQARLKGLEIAWSIDPTTPRTLLGDRNRFQQVLINLISNAVKYTDRGGVSIMLSVDALANGSCDFSVSVEDTGVGISKSEQRRVFSEFERAGEAAQSGTGLGLAIALQIVRAMRGDITVKSAPGLGSVFTANMKMPTFDAGSVLQAGCAESSGAAVVIASDYLIERRSLAHLFTQFGLKVIVANEASIEAVSEAMAEQDSTSVDMFVVTDEQTATEAKAALAYLQMHHAVKMIDGLVLTTVGEKHSEQAYRASGFEHMLIRPVRPRSLLQLLADRTSLEQSVPSPMTAVADISQERSIDRKLRVLLAEDNDVNAMLATKLLDKSGCLVERVGDGCEAVAAVEDTIRTGKGFDLILMDIHMPNMDGLQATKHIRELHVEYGQVCPELIAVTANAFPEDRKRCLEAGMDQYLSKPFDPDELASILENCHKSLKSAC